MTTALIAPNKYVQGPGELSKFPEYLGPMGKNALCLMSENGIKRYKKGLDEAFASSDVNIKYEKFNGECSDEEIKRLITICREAGIDVMIGMGGGKVMDTAKAVGFYEDLPAVIVPTAASTDAPCSALSVVYTEDGQFDRYLYLKQNPSLVLVDTEIIVQSPPRLLVSGMGDALATYFEARACDLSGAITCAGGISTITAQALAELCYKTLLQEGYIAKISAENKCLTKSFEKVVEANTLLSGLGFESGGIAGAHAVHNGLTVLEECHHVYHGEKVSFGILVQLILENAAMEEIKEVVDFCRLVGLPITLKELGVSEVTDEKVFSVAEAACAEGDTMHNMPFEITVQKVAGAIKAADALGRSDL